MAEVREFALPDLGEGLEEGEIVEWLVEVGDRVELNDPIASIETAKAIVEVPSPFAGIVIERIGEVGETLEVGTVFVRIETASQPRSENGSSSTGLDADQEPQPLVGYGQKSSGTRRRRRGGAPEPAAEEAASEEPASEPAMSGADVGPADATRIEAPAADGRGRARAKPPVRKLARDLGVALDAVTPTGEGGVITRDDVRAAAASAIVAAQAPSVPTTAPSDAPTRRSSVVAALVGSDGGPATTVDPGTIPGFRGRRPGEVEVVSGIRKRIIAKMEHSRRDIPHALCSRDADLTRLWEMRRDLTEEAAAQGFDVRISPTAIVMRATILALRRFPTLNAVYDQEAGEIRLLEHINLGVAVDTDRGLMVPNVKDAHTKSLLVLAAEAAALAERCRDASATPADLTGGTFTVDNYGSFGNDDGNPIINAPEVGILGIGAIRERPWVVASELAVRRVARFTLAFDHRVCDGGEAGRFVTYVADLCEEPSRILLHG